ncbi:tagaturonate epimerase family protein [Fulvivirga sedimenti]|uniref:Tagaturonate epimerase family protein n=1 Tax=Fulvivirga sedimenti TaxID=2879465 RepID=A0A9X1HUS5_9BACT|nr:tagaturonate epimerase family protein [Fulvivirga sedimenti]MCA6078699.1 tagaturonate epimerase family protein [Fulvivirga sedimenti]
MELSKYSFGIGDRFGMQGSNQLKAFINLAEQGISVTPVWNKSHREHSTVGTEPLSVMEEAKNAVHETDWKDPYHVDADHITLQTVYDYLEHADFFTIDVAAQIGVHLGREEMDHYLEFFSPFSGSMQIGGSVSCEVDDTMLRKLGNNYWKAAVEAGKIYSVISEVKGTNAFIAEISMDEVPQPQNPVDLFFILKMMELNGVRLQTIAPRFPGKFNKGIDYIGNPDEFETVFRQYLTVVKSAISHFKLPENLKLSIHTGSDKFSLYPIMNRLIKEQNMGIHVKTAGTTWLEEAIGLAESGGEASEFIADIYSQAYHRIDELTANYSTVLSIDRAELKLPEVFSALSPADMAATFRHDPQDMRYNPNIRQLMHTAYKIAGENNRQFMRLVKRHQEIIGNNVYHNIMNRHLKPLFS